MNIFAIVGSTRANSSNLRIVQACTQMSPTANWTVFCGIDKLPHFNPDLDNDDPPVAVAEFRRAIIAADAVVICTPEYVFNLPGSLKNAMDWMVSTTIFDQKPTALITAAASGKEAQKHLAVLMQTLGAKFGPATNILIQSGKSVVSQESKITSSEVREQLLTLLQTLTLPTPASETVRVDTALDENAP